MSVILQVDGLRCHYSGTAGRGQVTRDYWDPPDHSEFFADRKRIYAKLGLQALRLADQLHAHVKLPASEQATNLRSQLSARFGVLDAEHERLETLRAKQHAEWLAAVAPNPLASSA